MRPILIVDNFAQEAADLVGNVYDILLYENADELTLRDRSVLFWPTERAGASRADQLDQWAKEVKRLISGGKTPADFIGTSYQDFVAWAKPRVIEAPPKNFHSNGESSAGINNDFGIKILPPKHSPEEIQQEISTEALSEDMLALRFTAEYREDWRYVDAWKQWYKWTGQKWSEESTLEVYDIIRSMCRSEAEASDIKIKRKCYTAAVVAGVEKMAKADRAHAMTSEGWDRDSWMLNTPQGVIDLHTGDMKPHDRSRLMTRITRASIGTARPERWLTFLDEVTNGDQELQAYLARVIGYSLTGLTQEHALFFFYGSGANGKSVFLNTIKYILGDYATIAPADTFMEKHYESHPADIASLRGARAVVAMEIENGKRWAEAKLKSLVSGDEISTRFMRGNFFVIKPQFKLLIAGNHKPGLRDVDEAMRRRLHLIPFTATIDPAKRDSQLQTKLQTEADGIMAWAVAGCLDWQLRRLQPPDIVLNATDDYFAAEDATQRWINECCILGKQETCTTQELYDSWKIWADRAGEYVVSVKRFSENLANRDFKKWTHPVTRKMGFIGLKIDITKGSNGL